MRKASTGRLRTVYPLTYLYRDDIAQIFGILKPYYSVVKMTIGGYELDDASELANLDKPFYNWCTIKAGNKSEHNDIIIGPDIEFEVNVLEIVLTLSDDSDDKMVGIRQQIGAIIKKRTSLFSKAINRIGEILNMLCGLVFFIMIWNHNKTTNAIIYFVIVALIWLFLPFLTSRLSIRKGGTYTKESREQSR